MTDEPVSIRTGLPVFTVTVIAISLIAACAVPGPPRTGAPLATIICAALPADVPYLPVYADIDTGRIDCRQPLGLFAIRGTDTLEVPCQMDSDRPGRLWWTVAAEAGTESSGKYLIFNAGRTGPAAASLQDDGTGLNMRIRGKQLLRYNYAPVPPPPGADSLFTRGGFIHPVRTPDGDVLTRIHPPDHIHHLGIWTPWTKTVFAGRHPDFWNLGSGTGTIRFDRFLSRTAGPVFAAFSAMQKGIDLTAPTGEEPVLDEVWDVCAWVPPLPGCPFLIWDFTVTQNCAGDTPLLLEKYRYGGFGFRGRKEWNGTNSDYLTSGGETRLDGNGAKVRWCKISGELDNGTGGILFLSHPDNHTHPEPVRIWPQGDIFFGFCPVVYDDWRLIPGNTYVRRYRVITFNGDLTGNTAEAGWRLFAEPLQTTITYHTKAGNIP